MLYINELINNTMSFIDKLFRGLFTKVEIIPPEKPIPPIISPPTHYTELPHFISVSDIEKEEKLRLLNIQEEVDRLFPSLAHYIQDWIQSMMKLSVRYPNGYDIYVNDGGMICDCVRNEYARQNRNRFAGLLHSVRESQLRHELEETELWKSVRLYSDYYSVKLIELFDTFGFIIKPNPTRSAYWTIKLKLKIAADS